MNKILKITAIITISIVFSSCERNNEPLIEQDLSQSNTNSKLIGRWSDKSLECKNVNFEYPGYVFREDGTGYREKFSCDPGSTRWSCNFPDSEVLSFEWSDKGNYLDFVYTKARVYCSSETKSLPAKESVPYSIYGNTLILKGINFTK